jgi:hypothetical protein
MNFTYVSNPRAKITVQLPLVKTERTDTLAQIVCFVYTHRTCTSNSLNRIKQTVKYTSLDLTIFTSFCCLRKILIFIPFSSEISNCTNKCVEHGLLEHSADGIVTGILFCPDAQYLL